MQSWGQYFFFILINKLLSTRIPPVRIPDIAQMRAKLPISLLFQQLASSSEQADRQKPVRFVKKTDKARIHAHTRPCFAQSPLVKLQTQRGPPPRVSPRLLPLRHLQCYGGGLQAVPACFLTWQCDRDHSKSIHRSEQTLYISLTTYCFLIFYAKHIFLAPL